MISPVNCVNLAIHTGDKNKLYIDKNNELITLKIFKKTKSWINQEIKEELKQFRENNENEDILVQNLWDTAKMVVMEKYISIQASLKKYVKIQNTPAVSTP